MQRTILFLFLVVLLAGGGVVWPVRAEAPLPDDGPVLTKPGPEFGRRVGRRVVPEATTRPARPLDVLHYDITLNLRENDTYIWGDVRARIVPKQTLDVLTLDFITTRTAPTTGMRTNSAEVDGVDRPFVHEADSLVIQLAGPVTPADTVEVVVSFEGAPIRPQGVGYGLVRRLFRNADFEPDPDQPVICSLSEPAGARSWWPCNDHPLDDATVTLTTIGPPQFRLAAPGNLLVDEAFPGNRRRQVFSMPTPIPSYLVSLVLADQDKWTGSTVVDELLPDGTITRHPMPLEFYAPSHLRQDAEYTWAATAEMIDTFARLFGPYPYADLKYGMSLFVFGGAMEHATLSSMGDFTVSQTNNKLYPGPAFESIVAHELSHQWFGDAMHLGRWGDIWLNEGFARYCEILWLEEKYGPEYGRVWLDRIRRDSYPGPLRDPDQLFGGTVYNKGAWVLHQLRQVMGRDGLLTAMRDYMMDADLRFGPVFVEDFQRHCEQVYGDSLEWFFTPWLEQEGRPFLDVGWSTESTVTALHVRQDPDRFYRLPLPVRLSLENGGVEDRIVWLEQADQTAELSTVSPVVDLRIDPDRNWLLDLRVPERPGVELIGVRPNPFNPETTVAFLVRSQGQVRARIYDLRGRKVRTLFDEPFTPAVYRRDWDGTDDAGSGVASGVYVVVLESGGTSMRQKIALVR